MRCFMSDESSEIGKRCVLMLSSVITDLIGLTYIQSLLVCISR